MLTQHVYVVRSKLLLIENKVFADSVISDCGMCSMEMTFLAFARTLRYIFSSNTA